MGGTPRAVGVSSVDVSFPQLTFFAILLGAFALLLTERLRNDLVAMLIVVALAVTGTLEPREALSGFSSEPAVVVAAIFVLGGALHQTGFSETLGGWVGRLAGRTFTRAVAVIMPAVALLSAFTHHLTTTAVFLPVTLTLATERNIAPSKLLMPLSFAASLGTTMTIISAPAFLIASAVLRQSGGPGLSILSITPIGLALTAAGTLFVVLAGRFLLPERKSGGQGATWFRLEDYFTELTIAPDSPYIGKGIGELAEDRRLPLRVVGLVRDGRRIRRPFRDQALAAGDVVLVRAAPEALLAIREEPGVELHPIHQYGPGQTGDKPDDDDIAGRLVQAVVAPTSDLIGRTLGQVDFRRRYGALVLSLWRRSGWLEEEIAQIRLRAGDVLVLQGDDEALARVARDPSFLMMVPFQGETRLRRKAPVAAAVMAATIVAAATKLLSIEVAMVAGAVAMVLTGCLTLGQAYRAIDARIYVFIAGAIPLGAAMQASGAAGLLAGWLQAALGGWPERLVLLALFTVVAVLTQFMSDAATTALFAPVAVVLARGLGHAPEAYVVTVAMAAVASFLTPIGHHGNLLVYGPGGYRFTDFVRVGTPLTALVAVVVVLLVPLLWPAG